MLSAEKIDEVLNAAYTELVATTGYNGGMGGHQWDQAAARAIECAVLEWRAKLRSMATAPKDGTPVLLKFKDASGLPEHSKDLSGIQFVGRCRDDYMLWCFAAPVGYGGIPDDWLAGWMPLDLSPHLAVSEPMEVLTDERIEFGLNNQMEDPSTGECAGFYAGARWAEAVLRGGGWPIMGGRESLEDALAVVETFGAGPAGVNDTFARQIILAAEIKRLRALMDPAWDRARILARDSASGVAPEAKS